MNNKATFKIGPDHKLTEEQRKLVNKIEDFASYHIHGRKAVFTIYGDAGTGKSVVLSQLFYEIQQATRHDASNGLYHTKNYFLVNHPELLKVYRNIAGKEKNMYKKNFQRPTSFINSMQKHHQKSDVTIIDEAHLLLSQPDHYNNFYGKNQLQSIINLSQVTILVFDKHQVLRTKSYWNTNLLHKVTKPYVNGSYHLTHQFRMTSSDALLKWINTISEGKLTPIPKDTGNNFDFRIFDNCESMRKQIVKRNNEAGLARIISTSGYPSTLDGGRHYIHEVGGFKLPWDQYNHTNVPWAEQPQTINEVGSMFTCQGFDLNYTGVILGPPIYLKPHTNQVCVDLSKYTDTESLKTRHDMPNNKKFIQIQKQLVLNDINVLMKRGVKGLYIFAHDKNLRKALVKSYKNSLR